jgi:hypothetical protein
MAECIGSRAISPFGILALFFRCKYRHLIRQQYPRLRADCEQGGMSSYIRDVAIDVGLVYEDAERQLINNGTPYPSQGHFATPSDSFPRTAQSWHEMNGLRSTNQSYTGYSESAALLGSNGSQAGPTQNSTVERFR